MKAKYIAFILLMGLSVLATYAQEPNISFVLSQSETGSTKQYLASDRVTLKPGFVYNSTAGKTFLAKIDKTLPLPANSSTYINSSGNVTTNPAEGAIVGTVPGSAAVTPTGGASYQIPIEVPTGINGMQPQVAVAYNSQGGFGNLGIGWDIAGGSGISRVPQSFYHDAVGGKVESNSIQFSNTDRLALDGQRLILLNDKLPFEAGAIYGTEVENHATVTIMTNPAGGIYFLVTSKEGNTMEYGKTLDSQMKNANNAADMRVLAWKLSKVIDTYGNFMTYTYSNYGQYLTQIDYAGQTIVFGYTNNNTNFKAKNSYINSFLVSHTKLLNTIKTKSGSTILKNYEFIYYTDNKLKSINSTASDNSKVSSTIINWGSESSITTQYVGENLDPNLTVYKGRIYSGDVNGDGYADRIEMWPGCKSGGEGDKGHVIIYLSDNLTLSSKSASDTLTFSYIDDVNIPRSGSDNTNLVVSDINNDGKNEIIVTDGSYLYCYSFSNNQLIKIGDRKGLGLILEHYYALEVANGRYNKMISANVNNDQFNDIIYTYNYDRKNINGQSLGQVTGYRLFTGNSTGLNNAQDQIVENKYFDNYQIGDFNADGKVDIFGIPSNTGFYDIINSDISEFADGKWNSAANVRRQVSSDFNNDGLTDLIFQKTDLTWSILLNNGFQRTPTQQNIYQFHQPSDANRDGEKDDAISVDYNGDGQTDVVIGDEIYSGNDFIKTSWYFYKNNNGAFSLENKYDTSSRMAYYIADVNGDGISDLVVADKTTVIPLYPDFYKAFTMPNANRSNIVSSIYKGMNLTETFTYKNFSDYETYTSAEATAKIRPLRAPILLVDSHTQPDGSITTHNFEKPKYHTEGKGFLGFMTVTAKNAQKNVAVTSEFEINPTYYNQSLTNQTTKDFSGTNTLSTSMQTNVAIEVDAIRKRYIPTVTAQTSVDVLKSITQSTSAVYDEFGNVTTQTSIVGDDNDKMTNIVETVYKVRTGGTVKYLPETVTSTQKKSGETDVVRTVEYVYNANGKLTKETKDPTDPNKIVTEYKDFDTKGHALTVEVSITGKAVRKSTVVYTPSGRFVESKTNNLLEKTTYTWDETLGLLKSETDHWGRKTTYAYDAWNKPLMVTYPQGYRKGSALQWAAVSVPGALYYTYVETNGSSPVWTWYNALGQEVRKDYYGLNEKKICVTTEYNAKKQVYRVSDPYFENEWAAKTWAATYVYDSYGRPLTVTTKSDVTTMAYNTRTESVSRTAIGESTSFFTSSKEINSAGILKTSTENGKAVSFGYFPTGLTKTSTPEGGQALSMDYNLQGKRKYLKDPDAGEVFSIYNGFGELTEEKQKVHNSQYIVTTNNYNDNGTLNTIVRNGETTQYSYNDTEHKSRPTSISIANKNTQVFGYDYYGRLESVNETIGDRGYYTYYGYDMYGRETSKQYPSYYLVSNTYDKYGNLTEVKDANNRSIWKAVAENARGQIIQERKGNSDTYYGFDERGLPIYFWGNVVGMSYNFDNKGNLQYRSDDLGNEESFIYDTHDRLTNWNVTAQWGNYSKNNSIDYNPTTGNIDSKTDIGTFKYGVVNNEPGAVNPNPGPHALTSVTGALTALQPQALNVTYTDFKKIKTLSEGNKYYELSYGVDDQRRKSEYYANGLSQGTPTLTRYYLGDYEEEIDALGNIKQIHYLSGAIMIITITPSYDYEEHLYYTNADYQGSLIALTDENGNIVERYAYDPWGARRNPDNWTEADTRTSFIINRGYTGHEHLDAFGIINMNGRVYDPLTAMFFSPDPYVQAPGSWLNYNRYGYCFGNPMKYTDPSGEFVWMIPIIAAAVFGVANLAIQASNGEIHNFGDGLKAFGSGAVAGFAIGTGVAAGLTVPILGAVIKTAGWLYAGSTAVSVVSGVGQGVFNGDWSRLKNTGKIFAGNFYLDSDRNFFEQTWQGISRFSWELPQSTVGHGFSQLRNTFGSVDRVDYFGGATFSTDVSPNATSRWGVSLGNHINIQRIDNSFDILNDPLLMHEYGHTFDSQIFGPLYLLAIGIPSATGAEWTELRANRYAERYFGNRFGVNWTPYLKRYKLNR